MKYLMRGEKIIVKNVDKNITIYDLDDNLIFDSSKDYFSIYFNDIEFTNNGSMLGTFLGNLSNSLIDEYCFDLELIGKEWHKINSREVVTRAKLIGVRNDKNESFVKVIV